MPSGGSVASAAWPPSALGESVPSSSGTLRKRQGCGSLCVPSLTSVRVKKMTENSITKSAVLKIFRQLKPDSTTEEQNGLWEYVMTKASAQSRGNIAKAIAAGGDRARSSIAQAVKEWRGMLFLKTMDSKAIAGSGKGGRKQQSQQGQQRQQPPHEGQAQPPRQQQRQQQNSVTGKGRGAPPTAGPLPQGAGGQTSNRSSSTAKGAQRKGSSPQRTPWADLHVGAETPLLLPSGDVAVKCDLSANDPQDKFDKAMGYIMASGQAALGCACKAARRRNNNNPLVIVHQPASEYEKGMLADALREFETKINDEQSEEDEFFRARIDHHPRGYYSSKGTWEYYSRVQKGDIDTL